MDKSGPLPHYGLNHTGGLLQNGDSMQLELPFDDLSMKELLKTLQSIEVRLEAIESALLLRFPNIIEIKPPEADFNANG